MGKKRKQKKFPGLNGAVVDQTPVTSLAMNSGTVLGGGKEGSMKIRYESAPCPCEGSNANCYRCSGTGSYTKNVLNQTENMDSPRIAKSTHTSQESTFSNDARGDGYGIREQGRFSSNPLHDDHD